MRIIKRNGKEEKVKFDKILNRVKKQTYGLNNDFVDPYEIAIKVISGLKDGVTSTELDNLASETSASMALMHPDYSILGGRIAVSSLHKTTVKSFSENIELLYNYISPETNERAGLISDEVYEVVRNNKDILDEAIIHDRDFNFDYFGFKTLERAYLLKMNGKVSETPQQMYMRVAIGIWGDNIDEVLRTYDLLSEGFFTHATPTLFNSGTKRPQLSSCFLLQMSDDSIKGIYKTLSDCALISQSAGGIGLNIHNVRGKGAYIKGTNGKSNGIVPMLKVFNETARYVDQGGGKRKGSIAIYLEPWHSDIYDFLDLRKNHGKEEMRTRDLFLALWVPDLFMERIKEDGMWTLFSPDEASKLSDCYGDDFVKLYTKYENEGKGRKTVKARELWNKVLESQIETGTPYILYKDSANSKSNQKNLGTIKSSNLCTEIIEYTSKNESAVCNLASIALPKFIINKNKRKTKKVDRTNLTFDFQKLYDITYQVTKNLNKVIDVNYYPTPETKKSNMKHRPIGIGIQGLADTFAILGHPFDSNESKILNKDIFETIYFASMSASKDLAKEFGKYESFDGSPTSEGIFQYDMWGLNEELLSGRWDWSTLKKEVKKHGIRNSLLLAPMPTASTSQILGNNECFEPFTSNMYIRRTLSGEFPIVNKHLVKDLVELDLWDDHMKDKLIIEKGSVKNIQEIPDDIKDRYKTVWEMSQKVIIDMAADRGAFICQSQSMNLFFEDVNFAKLTSAHFYGWEKGLKTGSYYIRTKSATDAMAGLGVDIEKINKHNEDKEIEANEEISCSLDNPDDCMACGS